MSLSDPSPSEYGEMMGWPQVTPYHKSSNMGCPAISEEDDDETQGVQSKERWSYVKVNMDGVIIGRKVCIFDHTDYSSLALELEHMFGMFYSMCDTYRFLCIEWWIGFKLF